MIDYYGFSSLVPYKKAVQGVSCFDRVHSLEELFRKEIDDNPNTSPSKRILGIFPGYQKVFDGPLIVGKTGLEKIRNECDHFNNWITKLETI